MSDRQEEKSLCNYTKNAPSCRYCAHHVWSILPYSLATAAGVCAVGLFRVSSTGGCDRFVRCKYKERQKAHIQSCNVGEGWRWLPPYEHL